jgi:uncharacterized protein YuzE
MSNFKFSYDKENDDLFLFDSDSKSRGSVELGNFVFDFDSKKNLVGVQIMEASTVIPEFLEDSKSGIREFLSSLKKCNVDIRLKNHLWIIKIALIGENQELKPIISIPEIRASSPALAYA